MQITRRTRTIGAGVAIAVALYVSGLLVIFTPLPLLYVSVARGRHDSYVAAAWALGAVMSIYILVFPYMGAKLTGGGFYLPLPWLSLTGFTPPWFLKFLGVGYFAFFVAVALALGEGIRKQWDLTRGGGTALLAGLGVLLALVVGTWLVSSGDVSLGAENYLRHIVAEVVKINQAADVEGAHLAYLEQHGDQVATFILRVIPSLVFVFTLLAVVLNLLVGRRLLRRFHAFSHVHNVARFRLPDVIVWGLIGSGVAFFLGRYIVHAGWMSFLAINGLIGLGALYFFQGMAVVVYYLQGIRFPLFRTLAYVALIVFFQTISIVVVAIGVADVWVNFRLRNWKARHQT